MKFEKLPGAWVLEAFRRGGVNLEELSQRLPDDVNNILYNMDTISPDCFNRLLLSCAEISGDQDFGLTMNERIDNTMYGLMGYLAINSSTVKDLFYNLEHYYVILYSGGAFFKVTSQKETVSIQYDTYQTPQVPSRHLTEWGLGFIAYFLKSPLGDIAKPSIARFIHDSPDNLQKLKSVFGQNLEFNQTENKLIYHKSILNKRISDVDPGLLKILCQQADKSLQSYLNEDSFLEKIRLLLVKRINGNSNASAIAKELNFTLSTFKRKLAEENIDFRKTKEKVKNKLAREMLAKTKVSISDVARKTGFSDQSSFTRFFIRCNHLKPLEYRKKYLSQ